MGRADGRRRRQESFLPGSAGWAGEAARFRRRIVTAGLGVAVLFVVGLLAALVPWGSARPQPAAPARPAPGSPGEETAGSSDAPLPAMSLPPDVELRLVGFLHSVPFSRSVGPHDTTRGLARGFAHTGVGAAFAAVHILARSLYCVPPRVFTETIRTQFVGSGRDIVLDTVTGDYRALRAEQGIRDGDPIPPPDFEELKGLRSTMTTANSADVQIVYSGTGVPYAEITLQVVWQGADWVVAVPPDGDLQRTFRTLPDLPVTYLRVEGPGS